MTDELQGLGPDARALLELAGPMDDPDPRAKGRVKKRVMAAVAAGAVSAASATGTAAASAAGTTAAAAGVATSGAVLAKAAIAISLVVGSVGVVVSEPWAEEPAVSSETPAQSEAPEPRSTSADHSPAVAAPGPSSESTPVMLPAVAPEPESEPVAVVAPPSRPAPVAAATPSVAPSSVAPAAPRIAPTPTDFDEDEDEAAREPAVPSAEPRVSDTLREELALLRMARHALSEGRHDAALRALGGHRARFPAGALVAEREGTEALVLCAHPEHDGRPAARAFLATHPRSPLADRVRRCLTR